MESNHNRANHRISMAKRRIVGFARIKLNFPSRVGSFYSSPIRRVYIGKCPPDGGYSALGKMLVASGNLFERIEAESSIPDLAFPKPKVRQGKQDLIVQNSKTLEAQYRVISSFSSNCSGLNQWADSYYLLLKVRERGAFGVRHRHVLP